MFIPVEELTIEKINECLNKGIQIQIKDGRKHLKEHFKKLYDFYINGELYPPTYFKTFGFNRVDSFTQSLKKYGRLLNNKETRRIYKHQIQSKTHQTMINKYGVKHALQSEVFKDKAKQTMIDNFGVDNALKSEAIKTKIKQNNLKKYQVEYPTKTKEVKDKIKQTMLERYGVDNAFKSETIKSKIEQTSLKKYGTSYPSQSKEVRDKIKQTMLERYGVEFTFESEALFEKVKQTMIERYNTDNASKSPLIQQLRRESNEKLKELNEKITQFHQNQLSKAQLMDYLINTYSLSHIYKILNDNNLIDEKFTLPEIKIKEYLESHNIDFETHQRQLIKPYELDFYLPGLNLAIEVNGVYWHRNNRNKHLNKLKLCTKNNLKLIQLTDVEVMECFDEVKKLLDYHLFNREFEYLNLLFPTNSLDYAIETLNVDEFDFHEFESPKIQFKGFDYFGCGVYKPNRLKDYFKESFSINDDFMTNLGFESFVHLDTNLYNRDKLVIEVIDLTNPKPKDFNQKLRDYFVDLGYKFMRFTEEDIAKKPTLIQSMIEHNLGLTRNKIMARKCTIKEIDKKTADDFCNENHLHGSCQSKIRLGLFLGDELVHCCTFGVHRFGGKDTWELIRSCSKQFTLVSGAFQKIINHFKKTYQVCTLMSYVDKNISQSNSYRNMTYDGCTTNDLSYVVYGRKVSRSYFMKHNLHRYFDFPSKDQDGYKDIKVKDFLESYGVFEYYGSGNDRFWL